MSKRKAGIRAQLHVEREKHLKEWQAMHNEKKRLEAAAALRLKILERLLSEEPIEPLMIRRITEYVASGGEAAVLALTSDGELQTAILFGSLRGIGHIP